MKIASWNVNSLRARLLLVAEWLAQEKPDVILFQETKVQDMMFPQDFFHERGYEVSFWGQKAYNGVAIASRFPFEHAARKEWAGQARYLEALIKGVRVISVYVVNGQAVGTPAYEEKLAFLEELTSHLSPYLKELRPTVMGGDFNIAPYDEDVYDAKVWKGRILCSQRERDAWRRLLYQGWGDSLWTTPGEKNPFSWWPYRARGFEKDHGLRIDGCLLSPVALDRLQESGVSTQWRGRPQPSDHAPVWVKLEEENL